MTHFLKKYRFWLLTPILFLFPHFMFSQGGNQWTSSVNVAGGTNLSDWIYDVITTQEKNYFAVGFAKEDEQNTTPRPDVPYFTLISPSGLMLADGFVEIPSLENPANTARGRLFNVVEGIDAYFSVGCIDCFNAFTQGFLVKVNKTTLAEQHWSLLPSGSTSGRLNDIVNVSAGGENYIVVTGWANDGTGRKNWIAAYNYDGTLRTNGSVLHELVTPALGESGAMVHDIAPDGKVRVYTASAVFKSQSSDPTFPLLRRDQDIQVNVTSYDPSSSIPFTIGTPVEVNSITSRPYTGPNANGAIAPGPNDIFEVYKPRFTNGESDKYPYGPKYLGTSFARINMTNCNESAPAPGLLYM